MADSGFTIDGLEQLRAAALQLPAAMTERLKAVAASSAASIQAGARDRLLAQANAPETADAITIVADEGNKEYRVVSNAPAGKPANFPLWFEYGTVHQRPRPYMGPAVDAEAPNYLSSLEAAAMDLLTTLLD